MQIYLHSPNSPSWRGAQLKKLTHSLKSNVGIVSYNRLQVDYVQIRDARKSSVGITTWHSQQFTLTITDGKCKLCEPTETYTLTRTNKQTNKQTNIHTCSLQPCVFPDKVPDVALLSCKILSSLTMAARTA
jgi:hypothetical protein